MTDEMPRLMVPEQYRAGMLAISELDQGVVDELFDALQHATPTLDASQLINELSTAVPVVRREVLDAVVTALLSLFRASEDLGIAVPDLCDQLAASPDLSLSDDHRPLLAARLGYLSQAPALAVTSTALIVATASERPYHSAQVLPQIRPVFVSGSSDGPSAGVLLHTLVVQYHGDTGGISQIHFTLDSSDLTALREVLVRAEANSEALVTAFRSTSIRLLDYAERSSENA